MYCAIDVETSKDPCMFPWQQGSFLVSICAVGSDKEVRTWIINHNDNPDPQPHTKILKEVQSFVDKYKILIAHNLKFDLHWLRAFGLDTSKHTLYCTQVAEYLLNYQQRSIPISLAETSKRYGITPKIDKVKIFWDSGFDTNEVPLDILIPYGEQDTINALTIFYKQQPLIKQYDMKKLFQVNMGTIRVLEEMEWNGMLVDTNKIERYSNEYEEKINILNTEFKLALEEKVPELQQIPYNLNSNDHLSVILYGGSLVYDGVIPTERILKSGEIKNGTKKGKINIKINGLKFKPLPKTETAKKGFYKTDEPTLTQLKSTNKVQEKILGYIRELSRLNKIKNTYFDGIKKFIGENNVIHHNLNQTVTITGRLSSSSPNLQNQPRGSTGPSKEIFITRYSQPTEDT